MKQKNLKVMLSNKSNEWSTPFHLFNELNDEFNFTIDLAANDQNYKCKKYFTKENSGLNAKLKYESIFCNPPYGRMIGKFVRKCYELSFNNKVVMLIPSRTDTIYWHDYIENKATVRFIKGRIKFEGYNTNGLLIKNSPAPFPSCIVIFKGVTL